MTYIKLTNGQVEPYSIEKLRLDNPNTSFPQNPNIALLAEWNVYPCTIQAQPSYDYLTQTIQPTAIVEVEGCWVQNWEVVTLPLETASRNVRQQRNELLSQTDWMALSDNVMQPSWGTYRQALRDLTTQSGFPYLVVWPSKPE